MITWSSDWAFPVRAMKCGYSSLIRRWRGTSLRPLGRPCPSRQRKACSCFKTNRRFHPLPVAAGPYHHQGNGTRGALQLKCGPATIRCLRKFCWIASLRTRLGSASRSEEHTSELQSRLHLVCRLLLEKKKKK